MVPYSAFVGVISFKLAILIVSGFPNTAEASLFSAVSSIFASTIPQAEESDINSQKMPLLEAPVNISVSSKETATVLAAAANTALALEPVGHSGAANAQNSDTITNYKVVSGDTISGIAEKFDISVNTILWANNLKKTSTLKIGQNLVILPVNGVQHTVKSGDSLLSIASKYKADVDEILAYNDLDKNDVIKPGDTLMIPGGELVAPASSGAVSAAKKVASSVLTAGVSAAKADTLAYYARPLKGGVRTQGIHGNNGVDLADSCSTPLYASAAGTVTVSKNDGAWNGGYGNYVVITHDNGSQTLYGHMQDVVVSEGSTVDKGENIGSIGNTGKVHGVTGCHVHFEIRNGPRNPF